MLEIFYGKRGSGKTKKMITAANDAVKTSTGDVVYIDDDNRCMLDLNHSIRFMNTQEYDVATPCMFLGFLNGVMASDYDIKEVFIDGFPKIVSLEDIAELEETITALKKLADKFNIRVTISISGPKGEEPAFVKPFLAS